MGRDAILTAAMEAGCDEAERLGYGSKLGYSEAASIANVAAIAALAQACEFLRSATYHDPGSGRDRHVNGWRGAAEALERAE